MKRNLFIIIIILMCHKLFCQEWSVAIDIGGIWSIKDAVTVDNGGSVLDVGLLSNGNGFMVKTGKEGDYIDRVVHVPGMRLAYYSALELGNGNYMVFGVCDDSLCDPQYQRYIRVDVYDSELTPLTSRMYDVGDGTFECFAAADQGRKMLNAILSPSGTVILAAAPAFYIEEYGYYQKALQMYELDNEGNILVRKALPDGYASSIEKITYEPHSDNLLMAVEGGEFYASTGTPGIYVVNMNFDIVSRKDLKKVQGGYGYEVDDIDDVSTDGRWIDGDRLILNTTKTRLNRETFYYASMYVVDSALNVYAELRLPPYDSCTFIIEGTSTAYINDSTIFVVTHSAEWVFAGLFQANVVLVDKHLNLLGRKVFRESDLSYKPEHPVAFDDGGCLIPIIRRRGMYEPGNPEFEGMLMKFRREDIEITWDVVEEEGERAELSPYPNPCNGTVNIPLIGSVTGNARILLFDSGGVKCLDNTIGQAGNLIRLDTGNLAPGLYVYRIINGNSTIAEGKFVKAP